MASVTSEVTEPVRVTAWTRVRKSSGLPSKSTVSAAGPRAGNAGRFIEGINARASSIVTFTPVMRTFRARSSGRSRCSTSPVMLNCEAPTVRSRRRTPRAPNVPWASRSSPIRPLRKSTAGSSALNSRRSRFLRARRTRTGASRRRSSARPSSRFTLSRAASSRRRDCPVASTSPRTAAPSGVKRKSPARESSSSPA